MTFFNNAPGGIIILHENPEWIPPFEDAFARAGQPFTQWLLTEGGIDLSVPPPEGVFFSRVSASAPSRGHAAAKEYGRAMLAWLEASGRKVVNGSHVLEFEVSKVRQHLALAAAGFDVPATQAAFSPADILSAADAQGYPVILKYNQGGKGIGVQRFTSREELAAHLLSNEHGASDDGIWLVQENVESAEPFITRLEFIGGRFHYAVRVDTSGGSFELCPADSCATEPGAGESHGEAKSGGENAPTPTPTFAVASSAVSLAGFAPAACDAPALAGAACEAPAGAFTLRRDISPDDSFITQLEGFLATHRIDVAGVEFIETRDGRRVVYDINTNTNYNSAVEEEAEVRATDRLVEYLQSLLTAQH